MCVSGGLVSSCVCVRWLLFPYMHILGCFLSTGTSLKLLAMDLNMVNAWKEELSQIKQILSFFS